MASMSALSAYPRSETSTATARSDGVHESINCDRTFFASLAGDLDLVVGDGGGLLNYIENTGTSTAPAFVLRTGSANPFDAIDVGDESAPALADIDGDGTLRPCTSIDKLRHRTFCVLRRRR